MNYRWSSAAHLSHSLKLGQSWLQWRLEWPLPGEGHQTEVGAVLGLALQAVPSIVHGLWAMDRGIGQVTGDTLVGSIFQSYSLAPVWFLPAAVLATLISPPISLG